MGQGISIKNTSGSVQIDENYFNLMFESKATITTADDYFLKSGFSQVYYDIPATGFDDNTVRFLAFTCSAEIVMNGYYIISDGGSPAAYYRRVWLIVNGAVGTSITVYRFIPVSGSSGSNTGLIVRNASGAVIYDANIRCMKIATALNGTNYTAGAPSATLPSGKTYAICPTVINGRMNATDYQCKTLFMSLSGTSFSSVERYFADDLSFKGGHFPAYSNLSYNIMLLDVTGL